MALPERVGTDACRLALNWGLEPNLARKIIELDVWASVQMAQAGVRWPGLFIISGLRSPTDNRASGGARDSLHLRCPAEAVDLRVGQVHASVSGDMQWAWLGAYWKLLGGRWGGDFTWEGSPRPNPAEQNHFDLGVGVHA